MSANLEYAILPCDRLILERLSGPISYQDIVSLTEKVWSDEKYDKSYDGIVDIRHASLDMTRANLELFARLILASESASEGRVAVISTKPVETALSYLLADRLTEGAALSVFSTWEAVVGHLGLPESVLAEFADERAYDAKFN